MTFHPSRFKPWASSLLALTILAGGVAAPMSLPAHGAAAAALEEAAESNPLSEVMSSRLSEPDADPDLAAFYAAREGRPLWFQRGKVSPEAKQFIARLRDAAADGLDPSHYQPDELTEALRRARGDREEQAAVELMLSTALANWGADLHRAKPAAELLYSDPQFRSPELSRRQVLDRVATAPSLKAGIASIAQMNSIYMRLRLALAEEIANDGPNVAVIRANLERARAMPVDLGRRYILVDVAAQRLWAYEDGEPVDGMKVVVGRPNAPTPAMAAVIRFAVFRPYWNVPPDLIAKSVAPKVVKRGMSYFEAQNFEALSDWSDHAEKLDPAQVNWRAVAAGKKDVRVRQLPGPGNMMGQVKFMFPNELGVYLHDSPLRDLFGGEERLASAGCVRLEDATRLAKWLLDESVVAEGEEPGPAETRVDLPQPVPVYLVYFTAAPTSQGLSIRKDIYGRDPALIAQLEGEPTASASVSPPKLASR